MCLYVFDYVCTYVCMYVYTYVCMYVCICMYVLMYVCMYVRTVQLNSNLTLVLINRECLEILFESLINDRMLFVSNSCSVMNLTREW